MTAIECSVISGALKQAHVFDGNDVRHKFFFKILFHNNKPPRAAGAVPFREKNGVEVLDFSRIPLHFLFKS